MDAPQSLEPSTPSTYIEGGRAAKDSIAADSKKDSQISALMAAPTADIAPKAKVSSTPDNTEAPMPFGSYWDPKRYWAFTRSRVEVYSQKLEKKNDGENIDK